jgi:hypothetical protein
MRNHPDETARIDNNSLIEDSKNKETITQRSNTRGSNV